MEKKEAILGISCGMEISDRELALFLHNKRHDIYHLPMILQKELARQFSNNGLCRSKIVIIINTRDKHALALHKGIQLAFASGFDKLYLLAYPPSYLRTLLTCAQSLAKQHGIKMEAVKTGWLEKSPECVPWYGKYRFTRAIYRLFRTQ